MLGSNLTRTAPAIAIIAITLTPAAPLLADTVDPHRLYLTWQRDPATTMTVQWLTQADFLPPVENQAPPAAPHDVPPIDPDAGDLWNAGLELSFLADEDHARPDDPDDLSAEARLGWTDDTLLLLVRVRDDVAVEHEQSNMLWSGDGLEIFVSDAVGSAHRYQVAIAPGLDPGQDAPRHHFHPKPEGPAEDELSVDYTVRAIDGGYEMQVHLPWSNLDIDPAVGETFAFQFYVNDRDSEDDWQWIGLAPQRNASSNPDAKYAFRMADAPGQPIRTRAAVRESDDGLVVAVHASPALAGRTVTVRAGDEDLAAAGLADDGQRASVELTLPAPPQGQRWGRLEAALDDGTTLATLDPPAGIGAVEPAPVELAYWPSDDPDARQTAGTSVARILHWPGMFRHRVELTGLAPDTAYRFKAVGDDNHLGFRTMPASLDRPIRIAVGGDTRHNQAWMERVNRVAMDHQPDFILWGGDLAYADGREDRLYRWEEWFDAIGNTLIDDDGYAVPIVVAIGNHEVRGGYQTTDNPTDEWRISVAPYFYQLFAFPGHPGYNVLDFGDYLSVIVLDTAHTNRVDGEQADWLQQTLAHRTDVTHVIPIYHVTGYPSHRSYHATIETSIREHWHPLFDEYGIRLAFENHDHTYKRTHPIRDGEIDPEGIVYIGDGAWGVGVRPVHDPEETWYLKRAESQRHAIILTLDGDDQHVLVVNEEGEVIDEYPEAE